MVPRVPRSKGALVVPGAQEINIKNSPFVPREAEIRPSVRELGFVVQRPLEARLLPVGRARDFAANNEAEIILLTHTHTHSTHTHTVPELEP